jgi:hypothetical protein
VALGFLAMVTGILLPSGGGTSSFGLVLAGVVMAVSGFAYACASIRCPKCRAPWFWLAVKSQPAGAWMPWLMSQARCPVCNQTWGDHDGP